MAKMYAKKLDSVATTYIEKRKKTPFVKIMNLKKL